MQALDVFSEPFGAAPQEVLMSVMSSPGVKRYLLWDRTAELLTLTDKHVGYVLTMLVNICLGPSSGQIWTFQTPKYLNNLNNFHKLTI